MPKVEKTKKVSKVDNKLHPKSRKAGQISKAIHHQEKLQLREKEYGVKQTTLLAKVLWFKKQINEDKEEKYSMTEVCEIIAKYIKRSDDRLQEIKEHNEFNKSKGRRGRYHAGEEDGIKMVYEKEHGLFVTGKFEAPDLTNVANVKIIRKWGGDIKYLQNVKIRDFKKQPDTTAEAITTEVTMENE